ncbi:MAG: type II toxin-antitoxin system VapC family toxin [Tepidiformaceae bacterium]
MIVVLDTHVWLWWMIQPTRLSSAARRAIEVADLRLIAAISCWEVALLVDRGRVVLQPAGTTSDFVQTSLTYSNTQFADLTPQIAIRAAQLGPGFHKDPADRLIAATAMEFNVPLVTRDERMRAFAPLQTTW